MLPRAMHSEHMYSPHVVHACPFLDLCIHVSHLTSGDLGLGGRAGCGRLQHVGPLESPEIAFGTPFSNTSPRKDIVFLSLLVVSDTSDNDSSAMIFAIFVWSVSSIPCASFTFGVCC